jgi:hypothetical protein
MISSLAQHTKRSVSQIEMALTWIARVRPPPEMRRNTREMADENSKGPKYSKEDD